MLTQEDFFVWSAKVQSVDVQIADEKVLFVPFAAASPVPLQVEQGENAPALTASALSARRRTESRSDLEL